jgi:hypothetical protein
MKTAAYSSVLSARMYQTIRRHIEQDSILHSNLCHNSNLTQVIYYTPIRMRGRYNVVGIMNRYRLDGPGIESRWGARFFAAVQTGPGAHPASYTMGTGSLFRG